MNPERGSEAAEWAGRACKISLGFTCTLDSTVNCKSNLWCCNSAAGSEQWKIANISTWPHFLTFGVQTRRTTLVWAISPGYNGLHPNWTQYVKESSKLCSH
jgi:hypothetical protein